MKFLVVPSNRMSNFDAFLKAWEGRGGWDRVILVEDGPQRTPDVAVDYHYSWAEIDRVLGEDACVVSREDSAIRSFGFLAAWHLGATSVLTLDDDCYPCIYTGELFTSHLSVMESYPVWVPSVPGQRTRGLPYEDIGALWNVMVNVGLWVGIGDWDSVQIAPPGRFLPPSGSRVVPHGQLIPMCGMNLCFQRGAIPLMYFPPMGRGQPYRRFDDIWAGVIVKLIMDRLSWSMSVGEPFVEHMRASDPEVNRLKEAPGLEANEWFWRVIQNAVDSISFASPLGAVSQLGPVLADHHDKYVQHLGRMLTRWANLFARMDLEFR